MKSIIVREREREKEKDREWRDLHYKLTKISTF